MLLAPSEDLRSSGLWPSCLCFIAQHVVSLVIISISIDIFHTSLWSKLFLEGIIDLIAFASGVSIVTEM
jgi:hypothetical protein